MAKLGDIAGVWNTVREINVVDIRANAEQPLTLALIADPLDRAPLIEALRGTPARLLGAHPGALVEFDLNLPRERQNELIASTAVVLVLQGHQPLPFSAISTADKLAMLSQPRIVVIVGSDRVPRTNEGQTPDLGGAQVVYVNELNAAELDDHVFPVLVEALADDMRLALSRRIPGLRDHVAQTLINETSFSNATYALTSGLPEMIPLLNLPLNAADMIVLTKNQAILTYKLGLTYGAPLDFQAQMREILPVIGSGFIWRQLARQLIGLIPGFGLLPKVAVAYAGTFAVGQSAALWYSRGETLTNRNLKQLYNRAMELGRARARELITKRKAASRAPDAPHRPSLWSRIKAFFRRKPKAPTLPPAT